jgi:hypothetical protein
MPSQWPWHRPIPIVPCFGGVSGPRAFQKQIWDKHTASSPSCVHVFAASVLKSAGDYPKTGVDGNENHRFIWFQQQVLSAWNCGGAM